MALSVGATLGVASMAAAITFAIGTIVVVVLMRRRHRQLKAQARALTRELSPYRRTQLSVDSSNYAHVAAPRIRLRRSTHLPYGAVSEGWTNLPSQESIGRPPMALILERQGLEPELARQKRPRSLRATFSPQSFAVPKTRCQKKIDKAIPLNAVGRSPLSAITEFSDSNPRDVSATVGAVELPTEITPTTTPPGHKDTVECTQPVSTEWPLRNIKRISQDATPTATAFEAGGNSALMRMKSTDHSVHPNQISLGLRSISMASTVSVAPANPLPPFPTIVTSRHPQRDNSRVRSSVASTETVGSSVLGTGIFTPSHEGAGQTASTESPQLALSPSLLKEYKHKPESWGHTGVTMGTPPGTKTSRSLRNGATGVGSLRASIGDPLLRTSSTSHAPVTTYSGNRITLTGSLLTSANASDWHSGLSHLRTPSCKSLSPSLPSPVARYGQPYRGGRRMARHSMYEQHTGIGKISFNPDVLRNESGKKKSLSRQAPRSRPASVGTGNQLLPGEDVASVFRHANLSMSPSSQRPAHKRQNCVPISKLRPVDIGRRASKLPKMAEEDEQPETPTKRSTNVPGLRLVPKDEDSMHKSATPERPPYIPPFQNRPILNPTTYSQNASYSRANDGQSFASSGTNSDIFSTSPCNLNTPNIFVRTSRDCHWPLSPTPLNSVKLNASLSSPIKATPEPYEPESPILPSPTLMSATLFPRKYPLYGPRAQPSDTLSGRRSRTTSPSPLQRMSYNTNTSSAAPKRRSGDDLRRSVMMLRRMNSELSTGSQDRVSKIYHNVVNDAGSLVGVNRRSPSVFNAKHSPSSTHEKGTVSLFPLPLNPEKRLTSMNMLAVGGSGSVRHSNSRLRIEHSKSMISNTSIWEDASVRGDSPDPQRPVLGDYDDKTSKATVMLDAGLQAHENFIGQDASDRVRESKLTSPQGKGLGLVGMKIEGWGTPASLYDSDGFLKE